MASSVPEEVDRPLGAGRFAFLGTTSVRTRAARGTIVNAVFLVSLNGLGFLKGFVVARFLAPTQYGVWGLLVIAVGTLLWLTQVGIDDKYIQQDHPDQEAAFQIAFTLVSVVGLAYMGVVAVGLPLFALAYGRSDIILPGLAITMATPAVVAQTPQWIFYRRMDFVQQRKLQAYDPITSFVVTCALAVAGLGYWALVIGTACGSYAAAFAAVRNSPYPLRFRYERGALREYASFSWPLFVGSASGVLMAQIPVLATQRHLGTAAVGAIALAGTISLYANRVDAVVTNTIYPAVCAAKDRIDLLFEAFTKSNRLALLWGVPVGVGLALFAHDLVHFVIGDRWLFAVTLIQAMALTAALNQFAFNWSAFYRARNETRPMAIAGLVLLAGICGLAVPLMLTHGLRGYALGMMIATAVYLVVRVYYVIRLFPSFRVVSHAWRAIAPTLPAAGAVLLARALESGARTGGMAAGELAIFVLLVGAGTAFSERALLRELLGYLSGRSLGPQRPPLSSAQSDPAMRAP